MAAKLRLLLLFSCLLAAAANACAQEPWITHDYARLWQKHQPPVAKASTVTAEESAYDVQYLKFDLKLSAASAYISGNVTTRAKVIASSMTSYVFELSDTMAIDSVKINGSLRPFDTAKGICRVPFAASADSNTVFTAQVYYHGYPRNAQDVNTPGFHHGEGVTFSSVEPYFADSWWPCKQSLTDKIDSVDIWVTVPVSEKAGSNGTLMSVTPVAPGYHRYEWKERYPIDYYLISVAVSAYTEYSYYMHFTGSNDSMLIMNYLPDTLLPRKQAMLDSTGLLVDYFSTLFGRYPFWKEKYGHCYSPSYISMEHQTMTSTPMGRLTVIAHELVHQWFGDNVTCGSWKDIWLNEGFATYGQYLCYQHFSGQDTANSFMRTIHEACVAEVGGTVYSYDTTDWPRIFDGRLSYYKGAAVAHLLRYMAGSDAQFFNILRTYQQQYAGKTARTDDLQTIAETILNQDLHTFFHQWIYSDGFPYYDVAWNQVDNELFLRIEQTPSFPATISLFSTPIEIRLYSAQGDTTVTVFDDQPVQVFGFTTGKTIDSITIDPNHWLIYKLTRPPVKDNDLSRLFFDVEVYPNPASNAISVVYKNMVDAPFILYDLSGRKLLEYKLAGAAGKEQLNISALPHGLYIYKVVSGGVSRYTGKLSKQ